MKLNHTPGPWFTTKELLTPIVNSEGTAVLSSKIDNGEVIANKQIIAAAPELLSACLSFVELFKESDMRPEDECHELYTKMNQAISKATK